MVTEKFCSGRQQKNTLLAACVEYKRKRPLFFKSGLISIARRKIRSY